ncbi:MAG: SRPBCC domain-containing protein [Chitinophagaceae bacterium]|nr:SRPBCC domain-containing protein [Chitinophagaceae bacterium]
MKRNIRYEKEFTHPPEKIWKLISDSELLAEWLMKNDLKPIVGHRFNFYTKPAPGFDGIVYCEILEVIVNKKLVYSWKGGPIKKPTTVSWTLEKIPGGTKLIFEHAGFEGLGPVAVSFLLGRGWKKNIYKVFDKRLSEVGL